MQFNEQYHERSQVNGARWECRVFGCSSHDFPPPKYMSWKQAVHDVIRKQAQFGWDPRNPPTEIGHRLFDAVGRQLVSGFKSLEFYCSIGTALDEWHDTDGFFRLGYRIATIDLASARYGKEGTRSILFIRADRSPRLIQNVGKMVADLLNVSRASSSQFVWCNQAG